MPLEAAAQKTIVQLATLCGWLGYHTFDSRRSAGGFPDLVLTRDRVLYAELKKQGEKPRPDQIVWLDALASAGAEVYVWTIDDLDEVKSILSRRWSFFPLMPDGGRGLGHMDLKYGERRDGFVREFWTPRSLWIPGHGRSDA